MLRKKGFTLIELLVVIAIIAMLLAILTPALKKARAVAKATVCASNIKQWGVGFGAYWQEHNDTFWKDYYDSAGNPSDPQKAARRWHNALWPYVQSTEIFLCPTINSFSDDTNTATVTNQDMTFVGWPINNDTWAIPETVGLHGGYGFNAWACDREYASGSPNYGWNWRKSSSVKGFSSSSIPLLGDSWWNRNQPLETEAPPAYRGENRGAESMSRFCLDRHSENINMLFMDLTVRKVGLKELWTLKWHRKYNTAGPWTLADSSSRARWSTAASWMEGMKEY